MKVHIIHYLESRKVAIFTNYLEAEAEFSNIQENAIMESVDYSHFKKEAPFLLIAFEED